MACSAVVSSFLNSSSELRVAAAPFGGGLGVDLVSKKIRCDVQEMCNEEIEWRGGKGGAGVVEIDRSLKFLPAAMAARRA